MIVREQLKINETPYMLTVLGDLTGQSGYYIKAWNISGGRFARAKRTLAHKCFDEGDFMNCTKHLKNLPYLLDSYSEFDNLNIYFYWVKV